MEKVPNGFGRTTSQAGRTRVLLCSISNLVRGTGKLHGIEGRGPGKRGHVPLPCVEKKKITGGFGTPKRFLTEPPRKTIGGKHQMKGEISSTRGGGELVDGWGIICFFSCRDIGRTTSRKTTRSGIGPINENTKEERGAWNERGISSKSNLWGEKDLSHSADIVSKWRPTKKQEMCEPGEKQGHVPFS